jgi:hypothetical protein
LLILILPAIDALTDSTASALCRRPETSWGEFSGANCPVWVG